MFQPQSALTKCKLSKKKQKKKRPNQVRKQGFYSYSKHFPQRVQSGRTLPTKATEERRSRAVSSKNSHSSGWKGMNKSGHAAFSLYRGVN